MYILIITIFIIISILLYINLFISHDNSNNDKKEKYLKENCNKYLPVYNPKKWNRKDHNIRKYNNCFAYAFRDFEKDRNHKPQPGEAHNIKLKKNSYDCEDILEAVQIDYPNSYIEDEDIPCKCGYYKTFIAISPQTDKKKEDYHFYRQDNNLLWSHKPGSKSVMNTDGNGDLIKNPLYSDRHVDGNNYSIPCGFVCVLNK